MLGRPSGRRLQVQHVVGAVVTLLRPCATSAGFTATPEPPVKVDMAALKKRLQAGGYTIVVDAKIILIVRHAGVESSLYDNGKVLLKTTDKQAAQKAYDDLLPHVTASARSP